MKTITTLCIALLIFTSCKKNKSDDDTTTLPDAELKTTVLAQGLSFPWELLYGPDQFIWFTEHGGKISRLNPQNGVITLVNTITEVNSVGEGGLLGMVLHPDFTGNPYVYVVYDYGTNNNYKEKVVRFTHTNGTPGSPLVIVDDIPAASIHTVFRLIISGNQLFITTGDAANAPNAQDKNSLSGKILRVNLDGSVTGDNPERYASRQKEKYILPPVMAMMTKL